MQDLCSHMLHDRSFDKFSQDKFSKYCTNRISTDSTYSGTWRVVYIDMLPVPKLLPEQIYPKGPDYECNSNEAYPLLTDPGKKFGQTDPTKKKAAIVFFFFFFFIFQNVLIILWKKKIVTQFFFWTYKHFPLLIQPALPSEPINAIRRAEVSQCKYMGFY